MSDYSWSIEALDDDLPFNTDAICPPLMLVYILAAGAGHRLTSIPGSAATSTALPTTPMCCLLFFLLSCFSLPQNSTKRS
jgi:hypothetical protein